MPTDTPATNAPKDRPREADPLERLRGRVERAAREIERLRKENVELAERVRALADDEALEGAETPAIGEIDDPEALRSKIEGFIEALDRVLAERAAIDAPAKQPEHAD